MACSCCPLTTFCPAYIPNPAPGIVDGASQRPHCEEEANRDGVVGSAAAAAIAVGLAQVLVVFKEVHVFAKGRVVDVSVFLVSNRRGSFERVTVSATVCEAIASNAEAVASISDSERRLAHDGAIGVDFALVVVVVMVVVVVNCQRSCRSCSCLMPKKK